MIKSFIKDMLTYLPTKLLPALTSLITTPIFTRLFLPDEYGDWALATGVTAFLYALSISGIGSAVLRFFPSYETKSDLNGFFTNLLVLIGLVVSVIGLLSAILLFFLFPWIDQNLFHLLILSIFVFLVNSFYSIFMEVLRVQKRSGLYTRLNLTNFYGSLTLGLAFVVVFKFGVEGLIYGSLLVQLLMLPFSIRATMQGIRIGSQYLSSPTITAVWTFAWPLAFGNTAFWALRLSDRFIIEAFRPGFEVGLYSAIYNISDRTINLLVNIFIFSMGPVVATTWEKSGRENTEQLIGKLTRLFLVICMPVTVGLSILALPFVTLLTGEAYHEGYRIVGYVAFSTFIWGLSSTAGWGLVLHNKTIRLATNQLLAGLINIGLNLMLVPRYGYAVAAVTTLIGYGLLLFFHIYTSQIYLTWKLPTGTLFRVVGAATLMGGSVYGLNILNANNDVSLFYTLLMVGIGAFIYVGALWFLGEITVEEKNKVKRFLFGVK
jgi:O-antigen/teichoic acid export membrane protein